MGRNQPDICLLVGRCCFWIRNHKGETSQKIQAHLQATLNSNMQAVRLWRKDKIKDALVVESDSGVHENILSLVKKTDGQEWPREKLLSTLEATFLRKELGAVSDKYGFIGFVLFDTSGYQILALLDEATGQKQIMDNNDFILQALKGKPVVSHPFKSEIPLPDVNGEIHPDFPTMFSAVPVRDSKGDIVAALSFRIRPETEFNNLMAISRFGETGETYAFDDRGLLLTESRFNGHLKKMGLLEDNPDSWSALNIQLRDPGGDMTEGYIPDVPLKKQHLTLMANSAIARGLE